ncbi:DUF5663 domain-containing protein [Nocardia gamkensis]|uniref:DUF5663 domain-containing protein n=1 Tax=Nocardia gamkensis TaxID=352869 RepID=UPI0037CA2564
MIQLNDSTLEKLGLADLPPTIRQTILETMYEQLEYRVGSVLSAGLTDAQLEEFEALINTAEFGNGNNDPAAQWLADNCPDYRTKVVDCLNDLQLEIADNRIAIRSMVVSAAPEPLVDFVEKVTNHRDLALARDLFIYIGDLQAIRNAGLRELRAVPDIGPSVVKRIRALARSDAGSAASGLPQRQRDILTAKFGSWENVLQAADSDILAVKGIGPGALARLRKEPHAQAGGPSRPG